VDNVVLSVDIFLKLILEKIGLDFPTEMISFIHTLINK